MIKRYYNLHHYLQNNKVLIIYGPRQVGKTTLVKKFLNETKLKYKFDSGENIKVRQLLSSQNFEDITNYLTGYELFILDEAQQVPNIGLGLKIIVDQIANIKVIATGSSSFNLANKVSESLTGRKNVLRLFPVSQLELKDHYTNQYDLQEKLETFLIYGSYPEIITKAPLKAKQNRIEEIATSYLLTDILNLDLVKNEYLLWRLLQLLAYQLGSLVSLNELANKLNIDVKTVQRYLDLLEKSFVILAVSGFSRNLRDEITSKKKYYFYDLGIRNAVISNFNSLKNRNDIGALWENFIFIERLKKRVYKQISAQYFYWQNWQGQEIDLIEQRAGKLFAYEVKWSYKNKAKLPTQFAKNYQEARFKVINQQNYLRFVL